MIFLAIYLYALATTVIAWTAQDHPYPPEGWAEWTLVILWPVTLPIIALAEALGCDWD